MTYYDWYLKYKNILYLPDYKWLLAVSEMEVSEDKFLNQVVKHQVVWNVEKL